MLALDVVDVAAIAVVDDDVDLVRLFRCRYEPCLLCVFLWHSDLAAVRSRQLCAVLDAGTLLRSVDEEAYATGVGELV